MSLNELLHNMVDSYAKTIAVETTHLFRKVPLAPTNPIRVMVGVRDRIRVGVRVRHPQTRDA